MFTKCFLLLSAVTLLAAHRTPFAWSSFEGRIIGGKDEVIENVPWQVSLQRHGNHNCGGSILSERIIVTAAHCVGNRPAYALSVRVGSTYSDKGGTVVKVVKALVHEEYSYSSPPTYDVALLLLGEALNFNAGVAKPIGLAKSTPAHGASSSVTGWGRTNQGFTNVLQTVDVDIVERNECRKAYGAKVTDEQICAALPGKDSCQGDSGGPLVTKGELVGIVSWGRGCAQAGSPGVYADAAVLRDWILEGAKKLTQSN